MVTGKDGKFCGEKSCIEGKGRSPKAGISLLTGSGGQLRRDYRYSFDRK